MKPELSIIIVNYNNLAFIDSCLDSIFNSRETYSKEVIVVDNLSTDGSVSLIKSKYPQAILIENTSNLGFGKANNIGVSRSKAETIILLNPDTIVSDGQLSKLADFLLKMPNAGLAAPKLINPDGTLQYSCRRFYDIRTVFFRRIFSRSTIGQKLSDHHLMKEWDHNSTKEVEWAVAACAAIRRSVWEQLGGFDEKYMLYFEDVDLCRRISNLGLKVYYYPESVVTHHFQRESAGGFSKKTVWHIKSAIRYFSKFGLKF